MFDSDTLPTMFDHSTRSPILFPTGLFRRPFRNKRTAFSLARAGLAIGMIFWGAVCSCNAGVTYPKAPEGGQQIVHDNVGSILRAQPGFFGGLHIEDLTIADPYLSYGVDLNDLASGHLLSAANPWCWRYLLIKGNSAVGDVLLNIEKDGKPPDFNSVEQPFSPNAPLEALRIAEKLPQIKKQDYELRYLDIIHHYMAIWLHGKSDDIIIPIPLTFAPLKAYQPYSEAEIIKLLQKEAQSEQEMYKNDNGENGGKGGSASPQPADNKTSSTNSTNDWQTKTIASEADLDRVIALLQKPATRFDAFMALLEFAGYPRGNKNSNDPKVNALHDRAIDAIHTCPDMDAVVAAMIDRLKKPEDRLPMLRALLEFSGGFGVMPGFSAPSTPLEVSMAKAQQAVDEALDVPTVETALADADWLLRITAVGHFGNPPTPTSEWERLLPQMEKLAVNDDSAIRSAADEKLSGFPGTKQFLAGRLANETSPDVILELLRDRNVGNKLNDRFLELFVPLLSNPEEKVREDALIFVEWNSHRAPMLQFSFGMDVFDRVIASTQAKSAKERWAAAGALTEIRQLDANRSREAFLNLANDPDEDVRSNVAAGLAGQYERDDVKQTIANLLKDKSPVVKFMTILAAGPQKYIPELEALSKGPDLVTADLATQKLKELANAKKN
jgi:hypothetical protein